jgi:putative nucleotidyltransferase with HDIG domain
MANKIQDTNRIKRITESIIGLPTLPTIVSRMLELVDNPRTSAASLARLISSDQALTARVLKLANSAYYGFPREISTVNMAIVVLGFNTVKDMGLSLSVFDVFKDVENNKSFDISRFWEHSIGCGVASRMLARNYYSRYAAESFVAGLLHDIGKIILNQYFHTEFIEIMSRTVNGMSLDNAEIEVIGTSHARIGAWLAEKWNLPKIISETILYHHEPWNSRNEKVFISIINLADHLCHLSGIGQSGRTVVDAPDVKLWEIFQKENVPVDEIDLSSLQTDFLIEFDKSDTFVSLIQDK